MLTTYKYNVLNPTSVNLRPLTPNCNSVPPLQHQQCPIQPRLTITLTLHKLPPQRRQARAPTNWQSSPKFLLQLRNFLVQLLAPLILALVYRVHGTSQEETDRFVDMFRSGDGG